MAARGDTLTLVPSDSAFCVNDGILNVFTFEGVQRAVAQHENRGDGTISTVVIESTDAQQVALIGDDMPVTEYTPKRITLSLHGGDVEPMNVLLQDVVPPSAVVPMYVWAVQEGTADDIAKQVQQARALWPSSGKVLECVLAVEAETGRVRLDVLDGLSSTNFLGGVRIEATVVAVLPALTELFQACSFAPEPTSGACVARTEPFKGMPCTAIQAAQSFLADLNSARRGLWIRVGGTVKDCRKGVPSMVGSGNLDLRLDTRRVSLLTPKPWHLCELIGRGDARDLERLKLTAIIGTTNNRVMGDALRGLTGGLYETEREARKACGKCTQHYYIGDRKREEVSPQPMFATMLGNFRALLPSFAHQKEHVDSDDDAAPTRSLSDFVEGHSTGVSARRFPPPQQGTPPSSQSSWTSDDATSTPRSEGSGEMPTVAAETAKAATEMPETAVTPHLQQTGGPRPAFTIASDSTQTEVPGTAAVVLSALVSLASPFVRATTPRLRPSASAEQRSPPIDDLEKAETSSRRSSQGSVQTATPVAESSVDTPLRKFTRTPLVLSTPPASGRRSSVASSTSSASSTPSRRGRAQTVGSEGSRGVDSTRPTSLPARLRSAMKNPAGEGTTPGRRLRMATTQPLGGNTLRLGIMKGDDWTAAWWARPRTLGRDVLVEAALPTDFVRKAEADTATATRWLMGFPSQINPLNSNVQHIHIYNVDFLPIKGLADLLRTLTLLVPNTNSNATVKLFRSVWAGRPTAPVIIGPNMIPRHLDPLFRDWGQRVDGFSRISATSTRITAGLEWTFGDFQSPAMLAAASTKRPQGGYTRTLEDGRQWVVVRALDGQELEIFTLQDSPTSPETSPPPPST
jgi:hypothetical protein